MNIVADWIEECDAVCVSVECRLALENPHPAPIEDCYTGPKWVGESLAELQIDLGRGFFMALICWSHKLLFHDSPAKHV